MLELEIQPARLFQSWGSIAEFLNFYFKCGTGVIAIVKLITRANKNSDNSSTRNTAWILICSTPVQVANLKLHPALRPPLFIVDWDAEQLIKSRLLPRESDIEHVLNTLILKICLMFGLGHSFTPQGVLCLVESQGQNFQKPKAEAALLLIKKRRATTSFDIYTRGKQRHSLHNT